MGFSSQYTRHLEEWINIGSSRMKRDNFHSSRLNSLYSIIFFSNVHFLPTSIGHNSKNKFKEKRNSLLLIYSFDLMNDEIFRLIRKINFAEKSKIYHTFVKIVKNWLKNFCLRSTGRICHSLTRT